jgi:hypothetical protein
MAEYILRRLSRVLPCVRTAEDAAGAPPAHARHVDADGLDASAAAGTLLDDPAGPFAEPHPRYSEAAPLPGCLFRRRNSGDFILLGTAHVSRTPATASGQEYVTRPTRG